MSTSEFVLYFVCKQYASQRLYCSKIFTFSISEKLFDVNTAHKNINKNSEYEKNLAKNK